MDKSIFQATFTWKSLQEQESSLEESFISRREANRSAQAGQPKDILEKWPRCHRSQQLFEMISGASSAFPSVSQKHVNL